MVGSAESSRHNAAKGAPTREIQAKQAPKEVSKPKPEPKKQREPRRTHPPAKKESASRAAAPQRAHGLLSLQSVPSVVGPGPAAFSGESLVKGAQQALEHASSALAPLAELPKRWFGSQPSTESAQELGEISSLRKFDATGASTSNEKETTASSALIGSGHSAHPNLSETKTYIDKYVLYTDRSKKRRNEAAGIYEIGGNADYPRKLDLSKAVVDIYYKDNLVDTLSLKMLLKRLNDEQSIVLGYPATPALELSPLSPAQQSARLQFEDKQGTVLSLAEFVHMFDRAGQTPDLLMTGIKEVAQSFKRSEGIGLDWAKVLVNDRPIRVPWSRFLTAGIESMRHNADTQKLKERFIRPELLVDLRFLIRPPQSSPSLLSLVELTYLTSVQAYLTKGNFDEIVEKAFSRDPSSNRPIVPVYVGNVPLKNIQPREMAKSIRQYLDQKQPLDNLEDEIFLRLDTSRDKFISSDILKALDEALAAQ